MLCRIGSPMQLVGLTTFAVLIAFVHCGSIHVQSRSSASSGLAGATSHGLQARPPFLKSIPDRVDKCCDGESVLARGAGISVKERPKRALRLPSATELLERPGWRTEEQQNSEQAGAAQKKHIFLVSDRTGLTVSHIFGEALNQFQDEGEDAVVQVFSHVRGLEMMSRIVELAGKLGAVVISTMHDGTLRQELTMRCQSASVNTMDVLGPTTERLSTFLDAKPVSLFSDGEYHTHLPPDYFKKIEAVDFAINQDDNRNPRNYKKADVVLVAVRSMQKKLAAMYMAQNYALKVANVKLVIGTELEPELAEVEPHRIFALTCPPEYLCKVRQRRARMNAEEEKQKGLTRPGTVSASDGNNATDFASMDYAEKEIAWCNKLFREHPEWTVVDVTDMSVEEVAEVCIRPRLGRPWLRHSL